MLKDSNSLRGADRVVLVFTKPEWSPIM
jgi:hypothetical protein